MTHKIYKSKYRNQTINKNNIIISFSNDQILKKSKVNILCLCGNNRYIDYAGAIAILKDKNTGLCIKCSAFNLSIKMIGQFKNIEDEILPSGSIIHWSQRNPKLGKDQKVPVTCVKCSNIRIINLHRKKNWDAICYKCKTLSGSNHPLWKDGKTLSKEGYIYIHKSLLSNEEQILITPMFTKAGYCLEHRLVMAKFLNRSLTKDEQVHHKNEIKNDNRIENLELTDGSKHAAHHFAEVSKLHKEIARLNSLLNSF